MTPVRIESRTYQIIFKVLKPSQQNCVEDMYSAKEKNKENFGRSFRKHLSLNVYSLNHDTPSDFVLSSWQTSDSLVPMFVVRLCLATFSLSTCMWSMMKEPSTGRTYYWFIYFSFWGLMLLPLSTCTSVMVSLTSESQGSLQSSTPCMWRFYWVVYNITVPNAFLITIYYWSMLYLPNIIDQEELDYWWWHTMDLASHGGNSVVMMLELLLSRTPSRLLHFYQPYLFILCYGIFTGIYHANGGRDEFDNSYIYKQLDWSQPGRAMRMVGVTSVAILALHVAVVCLAALRCACAEALVPRKGAMELLKGEGLQQCRPRERKAGPPTDESDYPLVSAHYLCQEYISAPSPAGDKNVEHDIGMTEIV